LKEGDAECRRGKEIEPVAEEKRIVEETILDSQIHRGYLERGDKKREEVS